MDILVNYHSIIIHFPIALLSLYILLEFVNLFFKDHRINYYSIFLLLIGVIGGIGSVLTGNQEFQSLQSNPIITEIHYSLIERHEYFASILMWYFFGILIFKVFILVKKKYKSPIQYLFVIFTVVGGYFLYETAKLGGILVYNYGIGTDLLK